MEGWGNKIGHATPPIWMNICCTLYNLHVVCNFYFGKKCHGIIRLTNSFDALVAFGIVIYCVGLSALRFKFEIALVVAGATRGGQKFRMSLPAHFKVPLDYSWGVILYKLWS